MRGQRFLQKIAADGDPLCDFDGAVTGGCTFHVRVCANNSGLGPCEGARLSSWELRAPSAARASRDPAVAAIRSALLGAVPGATVA